MTKQKTRISRTKTTNRTYICMYESFPLCVQMSNYIISEIEPTHCGIPCICRYPLTEEKNENLHFSTSLYLSRSSSRLSKLMIQIGETLLYGGNATSYNVPRGWHLEPRCLSSYIRITVCPWRVVHSSGNQAVN